MKTIQQIQKYLQALQMLAPAALLGFNEVITQFEAAQDAVRNMIREGRVPTEAEWAMVAPNRKSVLERLLSDDK